MIILTRIKLSSCNVNVFDRIRMSWLACVEAIEEESRWYMSSDLHLEVARTFNS